MGKGEGIRYTHKGGGVGFVYREKGAKVVWRWLVGYSGFVVVEVL